MSSKTVTFRFYLVCEPLPASDSELGAVYEAHLEQAATSIQAVAEQPLVTLLPPPHSKPAARFNGTGYLHRMLELPEGAMCPGRDVALELFRSPHDLRETPVGTLSPWDILTAALGAEGNRAGVVLVESEMLSRFAGRYAAVGFALPGYGKVFAAQAAVDLVSGAATLGSRLLRPV